MTIVHCPLCGHAHPSAVLLCDACGQPLHELLDVRELREEQRARERQVALWIAVVFAIVFINVATVAHVGLFLVAAAPLAWIVWNGVRFRALSERLGPP